VRARNSTRCDCARFLQTLEQALAIKPAQREASSGSPASRSSSSAATQATCLHGAGESQVQFRWTVAASTGTRFLPSEINGCSTSVGISPARSFAEYIASRAMIETTRSQSAGASASAAMRTVYGRGSRPCTVASTPAGVICSDAV